MAGNSSIEVFDESFFDVEIDRRGTGSIKYMTHFGGMDIDKDVIPMWVADMDFRSAPAIQNAICDYANFGIYGYCSEQENLRQAVIGWYGRRQNWVIDSKWLLFSQSVMFSVASAIRALTNAGDSVLIFEPVYHHFASCIRDNKRKVAATKLMFNETSCKYEIDFDDVERRIAEENIKLILLCSPHNPVGRVWTIEELKRIANIAEKYGANVISDEIHSDFVWSGKHIPFMTVSEYAKEHTVTCIAPTKSFNLAGVQGSVIVCANDHLRRAVLQECFCTCAFPNGVGFVAMQAAYEKGEPWFHGVCKYIQGNIALVQETLKNTKIRVMPVEGTYLLWLDFRGLNLNTSNLSQYLLQKTKIWFNDGSIFGESGTGFVRMNVACPRSVLKTALERIENL